MSFKLKLKIGFISFNLSVVGNFGRLGLILVEKMYRFRLFGVE